MRHLIRFFALILTTSLAFAGSPKVAKDLKDKNASDLVDVIVQFNQAPTDKHHQKVINKGGQLKKELGLVKAGLYSLPAGALEDLAADPDVAYITPDRQVKATLDYAVPTVGTDIALNYGWDGSGIGVAVIDSGILEQWDIKGRVIYRESFIPSKLGTNAANTADDCGHGTHVAGIIAGNGWNSTGKWYTTTYRGMAPSANLINLRALDEQNLGTDSSVIASIEKAIALKSRYNIRVINLSLGRPVFESCALDPLCQAVERAWRAGIVVVVAAGNEGRNDSQGTSGYSTITAPGNDPYVITVGAMKTVRTASRTDDLIASYSSKGPTLFDHIVKPGLGELTGVGQLHDLGQLEHPGLQLDLGQFDDLGQQQPSLRRIHQHRHQW